MQEECQQRKTAEAHTRTTRKGFTSLRGGRPSAISINVIPSDHTSALLSLDSDEATSGAIQYGELQCVSDQHTFACKFHSKNIPNAIIEHQHNRCP